MGHNYNSIVLIIMLTEIRRNQSQEGIFFNQTSDVLTY